MDQLDAAVCRLLSCKYDESFVSLAKDSGRHLYSHLEPVQRRAAISSAVRLCFETIQRLGTHTSNITDKTKQLVTRIHCQKTLKAVIFSRVIFFHGGPNLRKYTNTNHNQKLKRSKEHQTKSVKKFQVFCTNSLA